MNPSNVDDEMTPQEMQSIKTFLPGYAREFRASALKRFEIILEQFRKSANYTGIVCSTTIMAASMKAAGVDTDELKTMLDSAERRERRKIAGLRIVPIRRARKARTRKAS